MYDLSHMKIDGLSVIPQSEFAQRQAKVNKILEEHKLDGMVFFSADSIYYVTGSDLIQTERPMVLVYRPNKENVLLVPRLEYEHAMSNVENCRIVCYPEYPGERHPMYYLADILKECKLDSAQVGADADGAPGVSGYRGPRLSEVCPNIRLTMLSRMILEMKIVKSPFEISLIRESARWGQLAHSLLQKYTRPGLTENEVSFRATMEATSAMMQTLGDRFRLSGRDMAILAKAGFRGQVGPHSYFPHAVNTNAVFRRGYVCVTGARASILGYKSELERNIFVGEPSTEQAHFFNLAVEAQNAAFSVIKPGAKCSDVDKELMRFFRENNLMEYWRHHTGHSIGLGGHESPFFDSYDDTPLVPGMCMTVEPGLYVEGLGGFRLSDTIVITETGFTLLTYYPRDINKLICDID